MDEAKAEQVRLRVELGARLRAWRKHRGMNLEELAARAMETGGISVQVSELSRIENGKRGVRADVLAPLVTALDLTMAEFYGDLPSVPGAAANG